MQRPQRGVFLLLVFGFLSLLGFLHFVKHDIAIAAEPVGEWY
jgi:hypothetical protein